MDLFKKTALPSIEDFAKDIAVKKNLTSELARSIRIIQEENLGKTVITDDERSNYLCSVLEAIFIHGLKDKITRKMSSVFGSSSERIPEPQFWTVVCSYSHKNLILEINDFNQITSDIGRARAWLRAALNDGLIVSHIGNMQSDNSSLQKHYSTTAYIRDQEQSDIMKQLLEGLNVFSFELSCNNSTLNVWNSVPLTLANLWTPPVTPQPVMPAIDVIDFFTDPKNQTKKHDPSKVKKSLVVDSDSNKELLYSSGGDVLTVVDIQSSDDTNTEVKEAEKLPECSNIHISNECKTSVKDDDMNPSKTSDNNESINCDLPNLEILAALDIEDMSSKISSSDSVPDFGLEIIEDFSDIGGFMGNKLKQNSGWSSTFDDDRDSINCDADQSYDSLLQSYNKNLSKVVIGTPELADTFSSIMRKSDDEYSDYSPESDTKSPDLDFEIVPKYLSAEHADAETKKLMSVVGQLCPEQGLDSQKFECYSCARPVGLLFGKSRLCNYDGYNYCYECHENEEEFIPARIVHNWDFKQYPVSKRAKVFLSRVVKDPLLDIKVLNPVIYTAVEEMAQMQLLRTQLTFLRSYIFTCKQSIAEDLRMRLWPREYLYEHVHLYSIDDLLEIPSGVLAQSLQKAIAFAKKHVLNCQLCLLKGFICEVCKNSKAIYPFDVETTYHCEKCLAVYHATCMDANKYCPKCIRRMKRQQLLDATSSD